MSKGEKATCKQPTIKSCVFLKDTKDVKQDKAVKDSESVRWKVKISRLWSGQPVNFMTRMVSGWRQPVRYLHKQIFNSWSHNRAKPQNTKLAKLTHKRVRQTWSLCPVWRSRGSGPPYTASQLLERRRKNSKINTKPVPVLIIIQKNGTTKRKKEKRKKEKRKKRMLHVMKC